jgi:hypothetical protein
VSNTQIPGDSGGPVYHTIGLPSNHVDLNLIVGIATFYDFADNSGYVSKVWNIMNSLGVAPYTYQLPYTDVASIVSTKPYGYGAVNNANNLIGCPPDGNFVQLYGGDLGDGGEVVGQMSSTARGDIWVYAYSGTGYYTHFYTYVSNNYVTWTKTMVQTITGTGGGPQWIYCGVYYSDFKYLRLTAIDDDWLSANIYIDSAIVVYR